MRRHSPAAASAAAILSLLLLAAVAGTASAAEPRVNATGRAVVTERTEKARRDKTIAYWTAERIASAQPRTYVRKGTRTTSRLASVTKPASVTTTSTGASWTAGGSVVKRTGKVLFTMAGNDYVCSASVIQEPTGSARSTHSLVMTAAHCAYDEAADTFATNWVFVPSFDTSPTFSCAQATIGCWTAVGLVVHSKYANEEAFTTEATKHDFAVAIVAGGGRSGTSTQLDTAVGGGYAVGYSVSAAGAAVHAFGYPASGAYKGKDLTYCAGLTTNDAQTGNATWSIGCKMTGGASGGPWLTGFTKAGAGTMISLNSYRYSGQARMFGPKFDADTQAVVNAAAGRTSNLIVR